MGFRTLVVKHRCKLSYSLNYLVFRTDKEEKRICIDEISTLVVQSTEVSMTSALLSMLMEKKVSVILCDSLSNPQSQLLPFLGTYNAREKDISQMSILKETCDLVWERIVVEKITNQARNLKYKCLSTYSKLEEYSKDVQPGDSTNREGLAAKVYFNSLFSPDFSRNDESFGINAYLNYGYSIILSAINRAVKICGFLTELGIHHIGNTNPFNLSCDLMEPLRPLIDYYVISNKVTKENFKEVLIDILNLQVTYENEKTVLDNAIRSYVSRVLSCLLKANPENLSFIDYELA